MQEVLSVFLRLLAGFGNTVLLFAVTLVLALPLGLGVAFLSKSKVKVIKAITRFFISIIRGTPLVLQLILVFYGPPLLFGPGIGIQSRIIAAIVAFTINYAAYFSEIFRGGIESVARGQYEAGKVLGLTNKQIFKKIILLQVIKNVVPPIGNEVITLVKDTSLAQIIVVTELSYQANKLRVAAGGGLWPLIAAGIFYFVFNALVAFILRKVEKKLEYIKV